MNWTDDSWSRQENVIAIVDSQAIAKAFRIDFDQLWSTGDVDADGLRRPALGRRRARVVHARARRGLSARIAKLIRRAQRRVRICSPVITTGPVLGTLAQVIADGTVDLAGCVDATQIREVIHQWQANRQRLVEAAAARAGDGRAVHRQAVDALRRRHGARLHAREGPRLRRHGRSSARSTSRAAARRTPRTCSRSRTPRSRTGWRPSSTRCARATAGRAHQSAASAQSSVGAPPRLQPRADRRALAGLADQREADRDDVLGQPEQLVEDPLLVGVADERAREPLVDRGHQHEHHQRARVDEPVRHGPRHLDPAGRLRACRPRCSGRGRATRSPR